MKKLVLSTIILVFSLSAVAASKYDSAFKSARKDAVTGYKTRSVKRLKALIKKGYKLDETHLTIARVYYDKGKLDKALEHYKKIPKSSEYWLEAVEEIAWSYMRQKNYSKSYAQTMTLLAPVFDEFVNSEAYYLAAINRYYVCDYQGVFKTTKHFKNSYKKKIKSLERIVNTKSHSAIEQVIGLAKISNITFKQAAPYMVDLPTYYYKDKVLTSLFKKVASEFSQSKSADPVRAPISSRLKRKIVKRFVRLAKRDLKKINKNIEKLHLVEAEVIQRVYERDNKPQAPTKKLKMANGKDTLSFPVSNDEVWIDELNSFEASTSTCPTMRSQKEASL